MPDSPQPAPSAVVPADAVTASGSGPDPNISPEYAELQVAASPRPAASAPTRFAAVQNNECGRDLGILGEPRVNVLELNLELDRRYPSGPRRWMMGT